ncbi:hypothetical protein ACROYT_G010071 [Oculina patagonica]
MNRAPNNISRMAKSQWSQSIAFPTGGFSHSFGFESATKQGFVTDFNSLKVFVLSCLQNAASFSLPFVNESHKDCHDIERIIELDGIMQAYLSNHVANRASYRQGNSLLGTACKTFGNQEMNNLQVELENKRLYGHFATVFGFMCGLLKLSLVQTQQLFLFSTLRTVIASAVRLGNVGPLQAQSIQFEMQKTAEEIRKNCDWSKQKCLATKFDLNSNHSVSITDKNTISLKLRRIGKDMFYSFMMKSVKDGIEKHAFPTGGFSHSFGFESATKQGFVTDFNTFKVFVLSCLQNAASFSLPFVNESHKDCHDIERIIELDGIMQAYLSNHVANRASYRQGNSLLGTACKTFGNQEMNNLQVELENKRLYGHFATVFGFMCGLLKLSLVQTQQLFLFSTLRTVIASAVRLGNVGPLQAQSIQFEMQKTAEEIRKK